MFRRFVLALVCAAAVAALAQNASAQHPSYGRGGSGVYSNRDWERFYHYPYVYYPQNYWGNDYYRSADSLYYRYPAEMRIPVYNRNWHNMYPAGHRYHWGHHFLLDVY